MNEDIKFNSMLNKRYVARHNTNLAARILAKAAVKKDTPLWVIIAQEISEILYIPRPAYALALSLFVGIILGFQVIGADQIDNSQDQSQEIFSFMEISTDWIYGGWL